MTPTTHDAESNIDDLPIRGIGVDIDMADCTHRWVIDTPNGPTSMGTCKNCGAGREFQNASAWDWSTWRTTEKKVRVAGRDLTVGEVETNEPAL